MLSIEISNRQNVLKLDPQRIERAAEAILRDAGLTEAELSIALVDDSTIHALNRQYLEHDYPTNVLSFLLERVGTQLEGEVIASAEMAVRSAGRYGWSAEDELLLYAIHGTLHLVGHDDGTPHECAVMRTQEERYLALFGLSMRDEPLADGAAASED